MVAAQARKQAPPGAVFFRLASNSSAGAIATYPRDGGYFSFDQEPSAVPTGRYAILYFNSALRRITSEGAGVTLDVAASSPWKTLPIETNPADFVKQLSLFRDQPQSTVEGGPAPDDEGAEEAEEAEQAPEPDEEDKEIDRRERIFGIEQRVQGVKEKNIRESVMTREVAELYAHNSATRIDAQKLLSDVLDHQRKLLKLRDEELKQQAEQMRRVEEQQLKNWDMWENVILKAAAKHTKEPAPAPDYTPVFMQAIATGGRIAEALIGRGEPSEGRRLSGKKEPAPEIKKLLDRVSKLNPMDLAKMSDPEAMTALIKDVGSAVDADKVPAEKPTDTPPLLKAMFERIHSLTDAQLAQTFATEKGASAFWDSVKQSAAPSTEQSPPAKDGAKVVEK